MKNKMRYYLVSRIVWISFFMVIAILIVQIGLSYLFVSYEETVMTTGYLDVSGVFWKKPGELTIYYSDMIRMMSILLLLIPYVAMMEQVVRHLMQRAKEADGDKKKAEEEKELLIIGMAHDLKTPITTIKGYSQALCDDIIPDEKQKREYLEAINRKAAQLDTLINLLFDYVSLGTDAYALKLEQVDIVEMVRESIGLFYTDFEESGIQFTFELPEEPIYTMADRKQLTRVFENLYGNALKYNRTGDVVHTEVKLGSEVAIYVEDTGEPIPEEIAGSLFEPFVMGERSRKSGSGNGLGLCIAAKIMELHHGRLLLSQEREGYTKSFVILLEKK